MEIRTTSKIFIIEDDALMRNLIAGRLEQFKHYELHCFSTSEEAIRAMEFTEPDLILLDYHLTTDKGRCANGLDFMRSFRHSYRFIPIIVLSAQHDKRISIELIRQGAVDYISKNDTHFIEELCDSVRNTLYLNVLKQKAKRIADKKSLFKQRLIRITMISMSLIILALALQVFLC